MMDTCRPCNVQEKNLLYSALKLAADKRDSGDRHDLQNVAFLQ